MNDDLVFRRAVLDSLVDEYNKRRQEGGLKLAWIELAVNRVPPRSGWISIKEAIPDGDCIVCMYGNGCCEGWESFEYEILTGRFIKCVDEETKEESLCFEPDRITPFVPENWDFFDLDEEFKSHLPKGECTFYTDESMQETEFHDRYFQVLAWMPLPEVPE